NVVRVLGQNQTSDFLAQRNVKSWLPTGWLLDREPYQIEVVMLVFGLEPAHPGNGGVTAVRSDDYIGAHLEGLRAMPQPADSDDAAVFLGELRNFRAHPAVERR